MVVDRATPDSDAATRLSDSDATLASSGQIAAQTVASFPSQEWVPDCPGYAILRRLGAGGMGQVFLARDETLHRLGAIKTVRPDLVHVPGFVKRFLREARAMARLHHTHVLSVYTAGTVADGTPYLVMEFADGGTLGERTGEPQPEAQVRRWVAEAARGLAAVHRAGLVHRDIKPANIMLNGEGVAKIGDLGLVHHLEGGGLDLSRSFSGVVGTPFYMSPEQIAQQLLDGRSDLFALGCTAFALLAGRVPFEGGNLIEVGHQILHAPLPDITSLREDLPGDWSAILAACTAKDPAQRFADGDELARALGGERVGPLAQAIASPRARAARRRPVERPAVKPSRWPLLAAGLGMTGLLIAGAWYVTKGTAAPIEERPAAGPSAMVVDADAKLPPGPTRGGIRLEVDEPVVPPEQVPVVSPLRPAVETTGEIQPTPTVVDRATLTMGPSEPEAPPAWASGMERDEAGWLARLSLAGLEQEMRWIPPGSFKMGSPVDEAQRDADETRHRVTLTSGFWLAATECRQEFWQAVMGANPSKRTGPSLPVENVSYEQVEDFLARAAELQPQADFGLPTEAQWEYACRAGTTTAYHFGDDTASLVRYGNVAPELVGWATDGPNPPNKAQWPADWKDLQMAWSRVVDPDGFAETTAPVASFLPNSWGLYDMHGNVWEWTATAWDDRPVDNDIDPAASRARRQVRRGGSWFFLPAHARSAQRTEQASGKRYEVTGFRFLIRAEPPARAVGDGF